MGKLIVIEGGDGSGKSSVAQGIAQAINGIYYKTPSRLFWNMRQEVEKFNDYNLIFYFYLTGTLFSSAEIRELLKEYDVVCDRYFFTTIAYHRSLGVEVPAGLEKLFVQPDYAFCLYANREETLKRLSLRTEFGPHDKNFKLQDLALEEFKKFPLEFFDTSDLSVEQSVAKILKKIKL